MNANIMEAMGARYLRDTGITQTSGGVVRAAAAVLSSVRRTFESQNFLEVITPVLHDARNSPFVKPIDVAFGRDSVATKVGVFQRPTDRAQLSAVPGGYLQGLVPELGNVYTIAPMFRGELVPTWLTEFRYIQATGPGSIEDAMKLMATLISNAVAALQERGLRVSERALKPQEGPVRLSYAEGAKQVGGREDEELSHDQYRELAAANGNRPVFLVGKPLQLEPYAALGARTTDRGPSFFEFVAPDAGEVGAGKEFESDVAQFWKQADNAMAARLGLPWHETRDLEAIGGLLSRLPSPTFSIGIGFERLTQYLVGARDIAAATAFPVVNGGALRTPIFME